MRKIIVFLCAIACVTILVSCSKKVENGFVEFSAEGKKYRIENRQFLIRVNPVLWEGEKVKVIPAGSKNLFEFSIGPTEAAGKKELEATGKALEKGAKEKIPEIEGHTFYALWVAETMNPEQILKSKITLQEKNLGLTHLAFVIQVPGRVIQNPQEQIHDCWIEIDQMTEDRIKGRFGGPFIMHLIGKEADEKFAMHQRGEINKETLMSEIEKEIQISDGIFDVPYKKLFRYE